VTVKLFDNYNNSLGVNDYSIVVRIKRVMENKINLSPSANPYLLSFQVAQFNLSKLIQEERLAKRMKKSKRKLLKP
jgi:hypothetical protein